MRMLVKKERFPNSCPRGLASRREDSGVWHWMITVLDRPWRAA